MDNKRLILNKYLPLKEIGSGGFGTVFVCKDMLVQRLVAIKKIELTELDAQRADWVREDMNRAAQVDALNAFETGRSTINLLTVGEEDDLADSLEQRYLANVPGLDEARTASALNDPTIVSIYDCQIAGNVVYLVMEYVEGMTLAQLLSQYNDEITLDVVSAVFESVSRALEVAHENGVLHFDIKPDNVLIDAQGNVKVTDFGLATLSDSQGEGTAAAGTIGYMPLEQMRQEALDARTDEWALASITYEMLAGQNPFMASTLEEALTLIDGAELTLPSRCWENLPEEVDDVLFKALDPDKEDRYETVEEFADDLIPLLGDADHGRRDLAALVRGEEIEEDNEDEDEGDHALAPALGKGKKGAKAPKPRKPKSDTPLRNRFSDLQKAFAMRGFAALTGGFMAALAAWNISQISGLQNPLFWAFVLGCAALGAIKSHVGALASLIMLSAALLANHAYAPGILLLLAGCAWWWFIARGGNAAANGLMTFPLAGAVGIAPAGALITGYCTTLPRAVATTALGAFLCVVCASFGSLNVMNWGVFGNWHFAEASVTSNMLAVISDFGTWCLILSWILASMATSLLAKPRKYVLSVLGAIAGFALVMAGIWFAAAFDANVTSMIPATPMLVSAVLSGALMIVISVIFLPPERPQAFDVYSMPVGADADPDFDYNYPNY